MYKVKTYETRNAKGESVKGYFSGFVGALIGTTTDEKGNVFDILQNGLVRAIFRPCEIEPLAVGNR